MPRAIWSGAISFGLVNVPIKLYSATSPKTVRFHQLHARDGVRIQQKRVCPADGEEVAYEDVVKGFEIAPDRYVIVRQDELDALDPRHTKTIDIEAFVELADIDPVYYDSAYLVAPATGGTKPYALLLEAMEQAGKVAIGRFVLRTRQQLCALRPASGVLMLSTMLYGDEVNSPERLDELDGLDEVEANAREVAMAGQLIEQLSVPFDPTAYRDEYRERVLDLIDRKAAGEEVAVQPAPAAPAAVPDLMAALEASVAAVRANGAAQPTRKRRTKAPAAAARARARAKTRT